MPSTKKQIDNHCVRVSLNVSGIMIKILLDVNVTSPACGLMSDKKDPETPTSCPSLALAVADMVGACCVQNSSAGRICVRT